MHEPLRKLNGAEGNRFFETSQCEKMGKLLRSAFSTPSDGSFTSLLSRLDDLGGAAPRWPLPPAD